jgi:hypothetical protein
MTPCRAQDNNAPINNIRMPDVQAAPYQGRKSFLQTEYPLVVIDKYKLTFTSAMAVYPYATVA